MNSVEYNVHWKIYFKINENLKKMKKEYDGYLKQIESMRIEAEKADFDFTYYENILMGQANGIDERIAKMENALSESCNALGFNNKSLILCN